MLNLVVVDGISFLTRQLKCRRPNQFPAPGLKTALPMYADGPQDAGGENFHAALKSSKWHV